MKSDNRFFDDIARVATGAVGAMSGLRDHIRDEVKTHVNRFIVEMDFVPREDFDVVEAMAKKARAENATLSKRIDALEKLHGKSTKVKSKKTKAKASTTEKPTTKKTSPKKKS